MIRIATTAEERRKVERYWSEMRRRAAHIRDAYERGEQRRKRGHIVGTTAHVDSMVLYIGYSGS